MSDHTLHQTGGSSSVKPKHRHEGPKNHLLAFALSILLTGFSFIAVAYGIAEGTHMERWFVLSFIVILAIFQAIVQLTYWMHMKDKGHGWATLFICMGFFIALTAVISALFWIWW